MQQPAFIDSHGEPEDFCRFRRKLIDYLRLPSNVSESALRRALERSGPTAYKNYLARAWHERP